MNHMCIRCHVAATPLTRPWTSPFTGGKYTAFHDCPSTAPSGGGPTVSRDDGPSDQGYLTLRSASDLAAVRALLPTLTDEVVSRTVGKLYQGSIPATKKVEDWPARCPRCGRDKSAVLLFSSWDCQNGCFK